MNMISTLRRAGAWAALVVAATVCAHAASSLPAPDPDNGGLTLPAGFHAVVVADGLEGVRFLAVAPNGDIYGKLRGGGIAALRDTDGDGRADVREKIAADRGTGVAWHEGYLYYSSATTVYRYKLTPGELVPAGEAEIVVSGLPDRYQTPRAQHDAKAITFDGDGRLFVECGSPSNALGNPDRGPNAVGASPETVDEFLKTHGGFWRFDPNKLNQTQADGFHFSTGMRHALAVAWSPAANAMFVCQNGRDVLNVVNGELFDEAYNAERVAEEFHLLREGANFGWPYSFYDPIDKVRLLSPEYGGDGKKRAPAGKFQDPLIAFPAHWAPMQMVCYTGTQFPARYRGGFFVAFHGSWNRAPLQRGYNVSFVPVDERGLPRGNYEVFADGFAGANEVRSPREAKHRPMGVAIGPDGSLYLGSDQGGRIWRVFHPGG